MRLLSHRWPYSLLKTTLIALFGAFLSSLVLSFIGQRAGLELLFGGGLGGRCGASVVSGAENLFGPIVTGLFLVILVAAFLFFASKRFNRWFASIGVKKPKEPFVPAVETEEEPAVIENPLVPDVALASPGTEDITETLPDDIFGGPDATVTPEKTRKEEKPEEAADPEQPAEGEGNFEIVADTPTFLMVS